MEELRTFGALGQSVAHGLPELEPKQVVRNTIPSFLTASGSSAPDEEIAESPGKLQRVNAPPSARQATRKRLAVAMEQLDKNLATIAELEERNSILSEEFDRMETRLAVHFMDGTEQEKAETCRIIEELRQTVQSLEFRLGVITDSRDSLQMECNELKKQCTHYRRTLASLRRTNRPDGASVSQMRG